MGCPLTDFTLFIFFSFYHIDSETVITKELFMMLKWQYLISIISQINFRNIEKDYFTFQYNSNIKYFKNDLFIL